MQSHPRQFKDLARSCLKIKNKVKVKKDSGMQLSLKALGLIPRTAGWGWAEAKNTSVLKDPEGFYN